MTSYSVALCSYNGEKYIHQQIDSILSQTHKPSEIVVCDDGSTDRTPEILAEYQKQYPEIFRIHFNEINLRSVKNFEKAISLCSKKIIFLSDQDDIWAENKAEKIVSFLDNHPEIDVVATNGFCIDENGAVHEKYSLWDAPVFLREKGKNIDYFEIILHCNIATGASMAFRAALKPEIMPFPVLKDYHHDEWIAVNTARKGRFAFLNDKLFYYRTHQEQQVGGVFFDKTEEGKAKLMKSFNLEPNNFSEYKKLLKRLLRFYEINVIIEDKNQGHPSSNISQSIKERYDSLKNEFKNKFPLKSRILFLSDKIMGKKR
ncbi:MAG: glycosyltransferase family 2 protein [Flavobacteriaceae bacterium]|nr:glycosyltransferase family 2 protein [Flavobacteriaceae bacterium]